MPTSAFQPATVALRVLLTPWSSVGTHCCVLDANFLSALLRVLESLPYPFHRHCRFDEPTSEMKDNHVGFFCAMMQSIITTFSGKNTNYLEQSQIFLDFF